MKNLKGFVGKLGVVGCGALCGGLIGCTTYVEQPRPRAAYVPPGPVYVPAPAYVPPPEPVYTQPALQVEASIGSVGVIIRTEEDFYEPLSEYGQWEVVGSYGRCWVPNRVDRDWRPYCNGNWERTDAGWYWASDEPWGWATYHYGRWDLSPQFGWYWVPQTQWSPAWVSWHEGGGYVGWAPLQPSARMSAGGSISVNVALIAPTAFVFVEPRRFLQPVRPTTVVVNNTTIVNKTVNITNIKIVNNTVINEGPRTQIIEQASGQKVRSVAVRELRSKQEAPVVARQQIAPAVRDNRKPTVQSEGPSHLMKTEAEAVVREKSQRNEDLKNASQRQVNDARARARAEEKQSLKSERIAELQAQQRNRDLQRKAQAEAQTVARELETKNRLELERRGKESEIKAREGAQRNARESVREVRPEPQQTEKDSEPKVRGNSAAHGRGEPIGNEQGGPKMVKKVQKKKGKGHQPEPEQPLVEKSPEDK